MMLLTQKAKHTNEVIKTISDIYLLFVLLVCFYINQQQTKQKNKHNINNKLILFVRKYICF